DPVQDDRVALRDLLEHVAGPPLRVHEVLADDLEPVHLGLVLEDVVEVDRAEADAEAEVGVSEAGWGHAKLLQLDGASVGCAVRTIDNLDGAHSAPYGDQG